MYQTPHFLDSAAQYDSNNEFSQFVSNLLSLNPDLLLQYIQYQLKTSSGDFSHLEFSQQKEALIRLRVAQLFFNNFSNTPPRTDQTPIGQESLENESFRTIIRDAYDLFQKSHPKFRESEEKLFAGKSEGQKKFYIAAAVIHYIYDHVMVSIFELNTAGYLPVGLKKTFDSLGIGSIMLPLMNPQMNILLSSVTDYFNDLSDNHPVLFMSIVPVQSAIFGLIAQMKTIRKADVKNFLCAVVRRPRCNHGDTTDTEKQPLISVKEENLSNPLATLRDKIKTLPGVAQSDLSSFPITRFAA
ncbi:MAG: hypothetical protein EXR81_02370, partial [Gammaproteobacteria bacterium]|nr:hypothetical protein [Gammaproteobacteria bacterium]